jgi:hypothetical protein
MAAVFAALIAIIAMTACGGKGKPAEPAAYPVKIETSEGIKTVLNPAFPKEGVVRYALQDDLTIGGEGGGVESVLNRPQDLKVDSQGNIYVLDWGDVDIKVFAPDGRLLRKFGKKGQGPGEFDIPAYFVLSPDGRIFLLSGRQNQIIVLTDAGTYLSSFRLDGYCHGLAVDGQNRIYFSRVLSPEPGGDEDFQLIQNKMALFRTDEKGGERVRLGEYRDVTTLRKVQKIGNNMSMTGVTSRESYTTSWLVGPEDRVYLGYNKDYLLTVYDPDWKPLFRFGREFTPLRHPQYKPDGPHPEFYPAFSNWQKFFDDKGNLWLEQYVEEGVKDHVFDVFSPEGIYLKQVRVPETLDLVRGDLAYSIIRTEDEFLVVKRFMMRRIAEEEKKS